jgi:hypothetical protein
VLVVEENECQAAAAQAAATAQAAAAGSSIAALRHVSDGGKNSTNESKLFIMLIMTHLQLTLADFSGSRIKDVFRMFKKCDNICLKHSHSSLI